MRIDILLPDREETLVLTPEKAKLRLTEILRGSGLPLNTRCGERDMCAGCTIELVAGSVECVQDGPLVGVACLVPDAEGGRLGSGDGVDRVKAPGTQHPALGQYPDTPTPQHQEFRACQFRPLGEHIVIRVPERARLAYAPQVLDSYRVNVPYARDPLAPAGIGIAIDIGTTTVALQAIDLATGEIDSRASGFNNQMHFGDDVLTRINLCSTDPAMLAQLQKAIVEETIQPLVAEALDKSDGSDNLTIACYAIAGNTTMLHLLTGDDPSPMGIAPFTPRYLEKARFPAGEIGLAPAEAPVVLLPSIAAYIGADLTAGLFASGLLYDEGPSLLVDVGTNGEILLRHGDHISGCATAAGPAFEGCGLTCGIRAGEGAISHMWIPGDDGGDGGDGDDPRHQAPPDTQHPIPNTSSPIAWERIGTRGRPTGLCGSAYVDFLAQGRRAGLLAATGRFVAGGDGGEHLAPSIQNQTLGTELFADTPGGRAIRIAYGQGKRPIIISEADVAKLLQAKAAIAAGILILLGRHGLTPKDVKNLYLAGGFGMHLDLANAIACGLLPGFTVEQIQLVGNTSLAGATLALLDKNTLAELSRARCGVEVVELNLDPEFEDTYLDQLSLP